MTIVKLYVGCGLTYAPQEYKDQIASFKNKLRSIEWIEVLDFWNANSASNGKQPDSHEIYCTDIHECVGNAHAMIGELSYPSTGLGWELATSIEKHGIRVLMCAHKDALVSHLPIGASLYDVNKRSTSFIRYKESIEELIPFFLEELKIVQKNIEESEFIHE